MFHHSKSKSNIIQNSNVHSRPIPAKTEECGLSPAHEDKGSGGGTESQRQPCPVSYGLLGSGRLAQGSDEDDDTKGQSEHSGSTDVARVWGLIWTSHWVPAIRHSQELPQQHQVFLKEQGCRMGDSSVVDSHSLVAWVQVLRFLKKSQIWWFKHL